MEKLVKFQSAARFADGTVWTSDGGSEFDPFDDLVPEILPQLGIQVPENHPMPSDQKFQGWTLFECEKRRLEKRTDRRASVRGTGTFQLYQPGILADMPATPGASVVNGRFRYRLDSVSALENQISYQINTLGTGDWVTIHKSVSIDQQQRTTSHQATEAFLRNARLHVIGTRYGGSITLPYETPEMLLEQRR